MDTRGDYPRSKQKGFEFKLQRLLLLQIGWSEFRLQKQSTFKSRKQSGSSPRNNLSIYRTKVAYIDPCQNLTLVRASST